jgi:hypothetical protein
MYWQEWAGRLKAELKLETEPVAVAGLAGVQPPKTSDFEVL